MKTTAIPLPRGQTGHCLVGTWQAYAFKPPFPSLHSLLWLMTSPPFQGGRSGERSLMEVTWHIVGAQFVPTGKAGGPQSSGKDSEGPGRGGAGGLGRTEATSQPQSTKQDL